MEKFIWNSKCNSFDPVSTSKTTNDLKLYTKEEVKQIFASCGKNQVIKDVDGMPTAVDLHTKSELSTIEKTSRINELKRLLMETDYQAIKYAEGELTIEEYALTKAKRASWRKEINELETI